MVVTLSIGEKGRIVLPAAVRQAAGLQVGDEVVVRAVAPQQIVIETREVVAARLRARFQDSSGTAELRRTRAADQRAEAAQAKASTRHKGRSSRATELRRAEEILAALDAAGGLAEAS